MKKIVTILIIALCLLFLVLPVIAAADGKGSQTGTMAGTAGNNGQSDGEKNGIGGADGNNTSGNNGQSDGEKNGIGGADGNNTSGNNGQSDGEKNGIGRADDNNTSGTPPRDMSQGNQQAVPGGNGNNPAAVSRTSSQIPGLKNQSGGDQGAYRQNTSTLPPGWVKNPNQVRDTVQSLLAMENRTGGIGPQVSAIAREFNNSAGASRQYEDRINNRDPFSRFFFGSDRQAAAELANLTAQNQARITEIENLMDTTTMDAETRSLMDGQLQILRQNLAFDQQLAARAQQDRGIFG